MRTARPCTGHDPLVFERGRCFRCGRLLASELLSVEESVEALGYAALALAVERKGDEMRREARDAGYLDTPERYRQWLDARMKRDEHLEQAAKDRRQRRREARMGPETFEDDPRPGFTHSVRSPLAPVML